MPSNSIMDSMKPSVPLQKTTSHTPSEWGQIRKGQEELQREHPSQFPQDVPKMPLLPENPNPEAFEHNDDIFTITPFNTAARVAFHNLAEKSNKNELDPHHMSYLRVTGFSPLKKSKEPGLPDTRTGFFRIGFDCPMITVGLKWAAGRVSRLISLSSAPTLHFKLFNQWFLAIQKI